MYKVYLAQEKKISESFLVSFVFPKLLSKIHHCYENFSGTSFSFVSRLWNFLIKYDEVWCWRDAVLFASNNAKFVTNFAKVMRTLLRCQNLSVICSLSFLPTPPHLWTLPHLSSNINCFKTNYFRIRIL